MDDNLFEAIQLSVWTFLFIFALSFALIQYNRIDSIIDVFIEANMFGSREDFVGVNMAESEVERNVHRAEVILAVLNIPDTASEVGNTEYKVRITSGGNVTEFQYFEVVSDGYVVSQGVESTGALAKTYYLRGDIPAGAYNTTTLANDLKNTFVYGVSSKYSVTYDDSGIYYKRK